LDGQGGGFAKFSNSFSIISSNCLLPIVVPGIHFTSKQIPLCGSQKLKAKLQ